MSDQVQPFPPEPKRGRTDSNPGQDSSPTIPSPSIPQPGGNSGFLKTLDPIFSQEASEYSVEGGPTLEPDEALATKEDKDLVHKKLSKHKYNEFVRRQEMNILAKELLIDLKSDPPICLNFLGLICASYLKVGWKKELHPDGTLFYAQKTRGELSKVHPEIDKIKRFYNEFLNHMTGSTNRTILPRSLLERTFGTKFTNTTAIYASFFEGDIEADMTALFDSIKEGFSEKSETEIAILTEGMLKDAKGWYEEEFGYDYKTLRELFDGDWGYQV